MNNIYEKGRNLEILLLKTRLEFSKKSPELLLQEVNYKKVIIISINK